MILKVYYFLTGLVTGLLVLFVNQRTDLPILWSTAIVVASFMAAIVNEEIDEKRAKNYKSERPQDQQRTENEDQDFRKD
jgi:hypothetical protein